MEVLIKTPSAVIVMYEGLNEKVNFFNLVNEKNPGAHVASILTGIALFVLAIVEFVCRAIAAPFVILVEYTRERIDKKCEFNAPEFDEKAKKFGKSLIDSLLDGVVGGLLIPALQLGSK